MKQKINWIVVLLLLCGNVIIGVTGRFLVSEKVFDINFITSYRDIPGVAMQKALYASAISCLNDLYKQGEKEYMRHKLFLRLTEEERDYINAAPVIPFAAEYDNYPVSFFNVRYNEWQGIAHDVLQEVEALTGLEFKIINESDTQFDELLRMLDSGDALIISELIRSHDRRGRFLWADSSFFTTNSALISKMELSNLSFNEVYSVKVGFGRNSVHSELFRRLFPFHDRTVEYDASGTAFDALVRGDVDLVMHSTIGLLRLTHYQELPGYKVNITFDHSFESTFGFNKNAVLLCSIVNKALLLIGICEISWNWTSCVFQGID